MTALLSVDAGQSSTRLELITAGEPAPLDAPGVGLLSAGGDVALAELIEHAWRQLGSPALACIAIGTTGWSRAPAVTVAERVRDRTGADRVLVADDAVTAHLGALGGADGVTVVAGTGVVALVVRGGHVSKVGGWGPAIDDEGGGYSIGRAGLRAAVRAWESGRPGALVDAARRCFGPIDLVREAVSDGSSTTARIAAFATDIADLAAAGDDTAIAIWRDAAESIAGLVQRALARVDPAREDDVRVALVGGLVQAGAVLLDPLDEMLAALPRTHLQLAIGSVLDGARLMAAADLAAPLRELIVVLEDGCSNG